MNNMGKQSSRILYKGKDHKDIFFRGKFHEAMYIGSELVWHKIKKEGYYSIIIHSGAREMYILVFNEAEGNFEIIRKIVPEYGTAGYNVPTIATLDDDRFYVSTLGTSDLLASSTDGINWENTNLSYENPLAIPTLMAFSYYLDYMWSASYDATYKIVKIFVSFKNGSYSIESRVVETRLVHTEEITELIRPAGRKSEIALYVRTQRDRSGESKNWKTILKIGYFNIENEMSGEICSLTAYDAMQHGFFSVNDTYIFFVEKSSYELLSRERYIYYSHDGVNFSNTLLEKTGFNDVFDFDIPKFAHCRNGMYYFYCNGNSAYSTGNAGVILTSDFKNFSMKKINGSIRIGNITATFLRLKAIESVDVIVQYFYNGERSQPEDGMIFLYKSNEKETGFLIYIDNMFFRESDGNRIIDLG